MSDQDIRLECLKLAGQLYRLKTVDEIMKAANEYYSFVKGMTIHENKGGGWDAG